MDFDVTTYSTALAAHTERVCLLCYAMLCYAMLAAACQTYGWVPVLSGNNENLVLTHFQCCSQSAMLCFAVLAAACQAYGWVPVLSGSNENLVLTLIFSVVVSLRVWPACRSSSVIESLQVEWVGVVNWFCQFECVSVFLFWVAGWVNGGGGGRGGGDVCV